MKKTSSWISSLFLLFLAACTNHSNEETEAAPQVKVNTSSSESEVSQSLKERFPLFFELVKIDNPSFSPDSITDTETSVQQSLPPYPIDSIKGKPFQSTLIYNSDRTKAVDLFSYNYIFSNRNGTPTAEAGEPDTEVVLLDFKNGKAQRIWFSGPSAIALDAAWVNEGQIDIAGVQENEEGERYPTIWILSLNKATINTYKFQQPTNLEATDYLNKRFTDIHFR